MSYRGLAAPLAIAAALIPAGWSHARLESARAADEPGAQVLYLPSGRYLKITSLGFPEVMADLVYIWSIQYYSNYEAADRFKYLEHVYGNVIAELDPHYVDPYLIGAMIMSIEAGDQEMALRLLDKGIAANPDEWILAFDAGFLCYDKLGDYARASAYFQKAMRSPGVPPVVKRLHAEMYNKMGDKRTSLSYWQEVLDSAESPYIRDVASAHVHDLRIEVDLADLRGALSQWRTEHGTDAPDLATLARERLVRQVPVDPEGRPYLYDPRTGTVTSQSRFNLRRQAGS